MINFYFRTNLGKKVGIGHYMRIYRLVLLLRKQGYFCTIFFDHFIKKFNLDQNLNNKFLYNKPKKISEIDDANLFINQTPKKGIVILDDYRLREKWQIKVRSYHNKLIVIDDFLNNSHSADILINSKPVFLNDEFVNLIKRKNPNTKLLLGPKYCIIDKKFKKNKKLKNKFKIIFYIGGGGDLSLIYNIINYLISLNFNSFNHFHIYIIAGPLAINKEKILNLSKKFKNIEVICSENKIYKKINHCNLFVGSAGISIFETALYKIPSILFKISKNQEVDLNSLEKLGHYFLLDLNDLCKYKKITQLILLLYKNFSSLKKIFKYPDFVLDDKGCERVVNEILGKVENNQTKYEKKKIYEKVKENKYSVSNVDVKYINKYLSSRNLQINRTASINTKKIDTLSHYLWWFNNKKTSYVFRKNKSDIIFFYHEKIKIKNFSFIKPGWCSMNNKVPFLDILRALKTQEMMIKKQNRFIPALGIIKKSNVSMIKFAKNLNWKKIYPDEKMYKIINKNLKLEKKFMLFKR